MKFKVCDILYEIICMKFFCWGGGYKTRMIRKSKIKVKQDFNILKLVQTLYKLKSTVSVIAGRFKDPLICKEIIDTYSKQLILNSEEDQTKNNIDPKSQVLRFLNRDDRKQTPNQIFAHEINRLRQFHVQNSILQNTIKKREEIQNKHRSMGMQVITSRNLDIAAKNHSNLLNDSFQTP